jgi:hypothetical protein
LCIPTRKNGCSKKQKHKEGISNFKFQIPEPHELASLQNECLKFEFWNIAFLLLEFAAGICDLLLGDFRFGIWNLGFRIWGFPLGN